MKCNCAKCEHRFYCLSTRLVRKNKLLTTEHKQIIAVMGNNWSGHIMFRMGGQRCGMELQRIEAKFGIDLHLDKPAYWQVGDGNWVRR